jgi:hypothetical protein
MNNGLTNTKIISLSTNENYLYAGTIDGVWMLPLSEIGMDGKNNH